MKERPEILFVTVRSDHGGGPRHLSDLLTECQKQWPELKMSVASPDDDPFGHVFRSEAWKYIKIPHRRFSMLSFIHLWKYIRKHQIDLVHSHGRGAGVYSRLLKFLNPRIKVIHTFHGFHHSPGIIGSLKLRLDQFLSPYSNQYISVSASEKELLQNSGCLAKVPTEIVMNGTKVGPKLRRKQFTGKYGLLARSDYAKGIDLLLHHLEFWLQVNPDVPWEFYLAGFPRDALRLPERLQNRVFLLGELPNSLHLFDKIDILLSTSRWEGFPLVVLEAMAAGIPTVLSDVPGNSYFIQNGIAVGFAVENSKEFVNGIEKLSRDLAYQEFLSDRAYQFVSKKHQIGMMAAETIKLYRKLVL